MPFLQATNGPRPGQRFDITADSTIMGRHPECQVVIDVGAVSRHHAKIVKIGREYYVEDLNSRNGTYVNEEMLRGRHRLTQGDIVRVCDVSFAYNEQSSAAMAQLSPEEMQGAFGLSAAVMIDDDGGKPNSTIMSKLDVSSNRGSLQMAASSDVKLAALLEITRSLGRALSLDDVLPLVLNSLFKIFVQADRGFIVMRTPNGTLAPRWTKARRPTADDTIRISRTICKQVMEQKEAILSADAATDTRFEMSQSIADFRIRSMMCAPLIDSEGEAIGVLQIDTLDQRNRFESHDLEVLAAVAAQASIAIDNAQMHESALRQRAMERDLEVARQVQRGFLPRRAPLINGYAFFNYYQPANQIGGDYFDYIQLPDGRVALLVADVVGHGVAAALLMAKLSADTRFALLSEPRADAALTRLNAMFSESGPEDKFVTLVMLVLDAQKHEVTIVNAGHMAPLLRRPNGEVVELAEELAGLPIGITDSTVYEQATVPLGEGDLLVLYTDGINEAADVHGEMFGIERIRTGMGLQHLTVEDAGQHVVDDVRKFLGDESQTDDMCLVCLRRA